MHKGLQKRNPSKIGKRKYKLENLYKEETDEEMDSYTGTPEEEHNE